MLLHKKVVFYLLFWERFYRLAKELGISSGAVTRWKNAEDPPSGKTLMLLADKLDCSVDYLLGRTDDPVLHQLDSSSSSAI